MPEGLQFLDRALLGAVVRKEAQNRLSEILSYMKVEIF